MTTNPTLPLGDDDRGARGAAGRRRAHPRRRGPPRGRPSARYGPSGGPPRRPSPPRSRRHGLRPSTASRRIDRLERLAARSRCCTARDVAGRQTVRPVRRRASVDHDHDERPVDVAELVPTYVSSGRFGFLVSAVEISAATDVTSSAGDCADQPTMRSVSQRMTRPCASSSAASIATKPNAMRQ